MAGAVFGDAGALLLWLGQHWVCSVIFVAGAALGDVGAALFRGKRSIGEVWVESRSAKRCYFQKEMCSKLRQVSLAHRRGRDDQFILGSFSDRPGIVQQMTFQLFSENLCQIFGGHFAWQAKYLVTLEGGCCCSALL